MKAEILLRYNVNVYKQYCVFSNGFIPAFSALEKTLNEKLSEAAVYPMPPRIAPATRAISAAPQYTYLPVKNHRSPFA